MQKSLILFCAIGLSGCQTVANVAQKVADSARGGQQASTEGREGQSQVAEDAAPPQSKSSGNASSGPRQPCSENFVVTGSFFTGKQFTSHAPVPGINPDTAYRRAYTEIVKKGWQIVSADKDIRMISANQQVNFSRGGQTVPLNILIKDDGKRGSIVSFTFSHAAGLVTSEDRMRDGFCQLVTDIKG